MPDCICKLEDAKSGLLIVMWSCLGLRRRRGGLPPCPSKGRIRIACGRYVDVIPRAYVTPVLQISKQSLKY